MANPYEIGDQQPGVQNPSLQPTDEGITRRGLFRAGGAVLLGVAGGSAAVYLGVARPESADAALWDERVSYLDGFFTPGPDSESEFPTLHIVGAKVAIEPGAEVRTFPTTDSEFVDTSTNKSYSNSGLILKKRLVAENPLIDVRAAFGAVPFISPGQTWILIDGPDGAGYVQVSDADGKLVHGFTFEKGDKQVAARDAADISDRRTDNVLAGPYRSYKDDEGRLRYRAFGFVYPDADIYSKDYLSDTVFFDVAGSDNRYPDVKGLGKGMEASKFMPLGKTI